MDTQSNLNVLRAALKEGGENLPKAKLSIPKGKAGTALLSNLCQERLLEAVGAKKNKYTVTQKGKEYWEKNEEPEISAVIRREMSQKEEQAFLGVLSTVQNGKKPKTGDKDTVKKAVAEKLIEDKGRGKYSLTQEGEAFLLQHLPADEAARRLRDELESFKKSIAKFREDARVRIESISCIIDDDIKSIPALGQDPLDQVDIIEKRLKEITDIIKIPKLVENLRHEQDKRRMESKEKIEGKIRQMEERLKQAKEEMGEHWKNTDQKIKDLETGYGKLSQKIDGIAKSRQSLSQPTPAQEMIDEGKLFQDFLKAHRDFTSQYQHLAGISDIPWVYENLKEKGWKMPIEVFHKILLKWRDQHKVVLTITDSPSHVKHPDMGIKSGQGLLYFIQMP